VAGVGAGLYIKFKNIPGGPTLKKYTGRAHPYIFYPSQTPGPGRGPGA